MTFIANRFARVSAASTIVLTIAAVAGCAASGGDAKEQFSLAYPQAEDSPYAAMATKYMKAHPGVTITLNALPSDSYDKVVRTQLQGGNASDIVMTTPGSGSTVSVIPLAKAGLISPLNGSAASLVDDSAKDLFFLDDKMYGMPTDISVTGTLFNLTKGGSYPSSEEALLAECRAHADDGVSFFALAGTIPINTGLAALSIAASRVYASTPDWDHLRDAGKTTFADTPGWRDTLQTIVDMHKAKCFQPGAEGAGFEAITNGFGQGTSLSAFLPSGVVSQLAPVLKDQKIVVEPFPAASGGTPFVYLSSDYALAISAESEHKQAAQRYLDWLAEPAQAEEYAELAGSLPVTGSDQKELAGTAYEPVADLIADGDYTTLPVNVWTNAEVFNTLGSDVQALLTGQKDVDQVLADLDDAWDAS